MQSLNYLKEIICFNLSFNSGPLLSFLVLFIGIIIITKSNENFQTAERGTASYFPVALLRTAIFLS